MLPGVDYVLYTLDITDKSPTHEQFRLFRRNEFIKFWVDLGLTRLKVSTAMRKRILNESGSTVTIDTAKHADVISIHSFTNSDRKSQ